MLKFIFMMAEWNSSKQKVKRSHPSPHAYTHAPISVEVGGHCRQRHSRKRGQTMTNIPEGDHETNNNNHQHPRLDLVFIYTNQRENNGWARGREAEIFSIMKYDHLVRLQSY